MKLKSMLLCASAIAIGGSAFGQGNIGYVTTGTDKYVLVEEATGTWCPYCPDGYQDLEQSCKAIPKTLAASWHASSSCTGSEALMVTGWPAGNPYTTPVSCGGPGWITGFPMGTVDRALFGSSVGLSRPWSDNVPTRGGLTPNFKVSMLCKYDTTTAVRKITVKLTAKCLVAATGSYRMSLLITEDSLSSATYPQASNQSSATTACNGQPSWWTGLGSPISPSSKYWHNSVVRAIVDSNNTLWGDPAMTNPAVGDSVTKTYVYTIPAAYNKNMVYVIGTCQKYGTATTDRAIENSIEARVKNMPLNFPATTGVADIENSMQDVEIYPNPARTFVTVKGVLGTPSDVNVSIFNTIGQVVFTGDYKANGSIFGESIMINNLSNGVYIMRLNSDNGSVTKQFTVNK